MQCSNELRCFTFRQSQVPSQEVDLGILSHHVAFSSVHLGKQQPTSNINPQPLLPLTIHSLTAFLTQCYIGSTADTSYETN
jgi:hypothetical protein